MTRTEIIVQLDAELDRLERARDYLTAALKTSKSRFLSKVEIKLPRKSRKPVSVPPVVLAAKSQQPLPVAAAPTPSPVAEPQIHRVPPRRRVERRQPQADKLARSGAALSGLVPAGPVAVSANEARKQQERTTPAPAPAMPMVSELRSEIGAERSLGSLIQAFERRTGINGAETP
jgi:hypothetical protein